MALAFNVCPSCGGFAIIDGETGWCADCAGILPPLAICGHCSCRFDTYGLQNRRMCGKCRREQWFERNGDALDESIADGLSIRDAIRYVGQSNKSICLCCGQQIIGGRGGKARFCAQTERCKKAARSLKYHRTEKGMATEEALELVLNKLERGEI